MGRELKRVPLDFDWPLNQPWDGYINHLAEAVHNCPDCHGTGHSREADRLHDKWYGDAPFDPAETGSRPLTPNAPAVRAFAERNVARAPEYYGTSERAIVSEAIRLADMWNRQWNHHLDIDDVTALVEAGRLMDLTHVFTTQDRWQPKDPPYVPTPDEVNTWSINGIGHDSINAYVCIKAKCQRLGVSYTCPTCDGEGEIWPDEAAKQAADTWARTGPPIGDGYQIWETVSEGSPISPVFSTARDLARHMATTTWGADHGTSYEQWLAFIEGPGWAPSMVMVGNKLMSGVEAVSE